jgi:hypothetical protein
MIVLEEGINDIWLTIAFFNNSDNYKLLIKDTFNQYEVSLNVTDLSNNKNLISIFQIEIVDDILLQDINNNIIFLKSNKRYFYHLYNSTDELIDNGYLIYNK